MSCKKALLVLPLLLFFPILFTPAVNADEVSLKDFVDFNFPTVHGHLTIKNVPLVGDINLANVNMTENSFEADLDLVLLSFGIKGKIQYTESEEFEAKCYIKFPSAFTNDDGGTVHSEEFDLRLDHDGIHISGDIFVKNFIRVPPIVLEDLRFQFDSDKKNFTGTADVMAIPPWQGQFQGTIELKDG